MQIKCFIAVAALALTAQAEKELTVGKGGALDFSKSGGVAIGARGVPEANQAAHGPVAMGGAMDFSKPSRKKNSKRYGPENPEMTCTEDIPWVPEWTPGATIVGEGPEQFPTTSTAAESTTFQGAKGQNGVQATTFTTPSAVATSTAVSSEATSDIVVSTTAPSPPVIFSSSALISEISSLASSSNVLTSTAISSSTSDIVSTTTAGSSDSVSSIISSTVNATTPDLQTTTSAVSSDLSSSTADATISISSTTTLPTSDSSSSPLSSSTSTPGPEPNGQAPATTKTGAGPIPTSDPPLTTHTPSPTDAFTNGPLTFSLLNSMGGSITISYQLGTYSPATGGPTTVASSLIGPSATTGTFATSTVVVAPVGWAGRMTIGKAGGPLDYRGTKIEGNNGFDGADPNADPDPDVDVSYVDGYSVPASCSCGETVLSGCNKELWDLGNTCENEVGDEGHRVCVNDPRNIHGPASAFFAPCAAAAYTYDYNDVANWQGQCPGNTVTCCIGTGCPAPVRQPKAKSKRELMALLGARRRAEALVG